MAVVVRADGVGEWWYCPITACLSCLFFAPKVFAPPRKKAEKQALPRTEPFRYERGWGGSGGSSFQPLLPFISTPAGSLSRTSGHILLCTAWSSPPTRAGWGRSSGSQRNRWGFWCSRGWRRTRRRVITREFRKILFSQSNWNSLLMQLQLASFQATKCKIPKPGPMACAHLKSTTLRLMCFLKTCFKCYIRGNCSKANGPKTTYLKGLSMDVAVTLKCLYLRAFILSLVVIPKAAIYKH